MYTVSKTNLFLLLSSNFIQGSWALPQDAAAPIMCRARPEFNPLTASATAGSSVQPTSAPAPQAPAPPQTPSPAPAPAPPQQKPQPKQEAPAVPAPKPATPAPKPQPPAVTYNNDCLGLANQARQAVNLPPMTWSSALQNSATTYAKKLQSNNPNSLVLVHSGLAGLGENLYANSGGGTCVDANKAWIAEKSLYNGQPVGQGNFGAYGHYTQIITKSVSQVGCNPDLSAGSYIVCHYNFEQIAGSIAGR